MNKIWKVKAYMAAIHGDIMTGTADAVRLRELKANIAVRLNQRGNDGQRLREEIELDLSLFEERLMNSLGADTKN